MIDATKKTDELLARQVAVFCGIVWDRLDHKLRARYLTLAASLRATVERQQLAQREGDRG